MFNPNDKICSSKRVFTFQLPRSTADIQFVQYHYKGGGAVQPPPSGTNGNGAPISSPDSGIGDNHGNYTL